MGLRLTLDSVYTSAHAAAVYCHQAQIKSVYCVGSIGLISELQNQGIQTDNNNTQAVVVGLDTQFSYDKIANALWRIQNGCKLIVCNQDKNYPVENGELRPGCGAMVSAILGSCNKQVDFVVGKPNTYMIELLANNNNLTKDEILVVGDSLDSDIEMANRFGCRSILVTKENDINQLRFNPLPP